MSSEEKEHYYLSDEEKRRVTLQVDYFLEMISSRYKIQPQEIMETVQWVRERKEFTSKLKTTGLLSILGIVISALALTLWEGVKALITGRQ